MVANDVKLIMYLDDALNDANDALNCEVYDALDKVYEVYEIYDALDDQVSFVANDEINNTVNYVIDR